MNNLTENKSISVINRNLVKEADSFAIKNFILIGSGSSKIHEDISMDKSFIFDGVTMIMCIKGNGRIKINYKEYDLSEKQLITIFPNQIIKTVEKSDDLLIEVLFFSIEYVRDFPLLSGNSGIILKLTEEPIISLKEQQVQDILELHGIIIKHYEDVENPFREELSKALLYALIIKIGSYYSDAPKSKKKRKLTRQEQLTKSFFKLLFENFREERTVQFYADKLCLTPKYLTTTVKKVTRHSVSEWINEMVIIEAKKLLKMTDLTVLQISEELNFPNPSFFGRFFKQNTGVTPLKYRRNI